MTKRGASERKHHDFRAKRRPPQRAADYGYVSNWEAVCHAGFLLIGAFTGIADFFGGFMNWIFMMAGSVSTNPMLFVAAVLLILAWKAAGYVGVDFFLLRWVGTPWHMITAQPMPVTASGD